LRVAVSHKLEDKCLAEKVMEELQFILGK
jgi:hypothetical protein